jgi:putative phage-type endonuclease
MDQNTAEWHKWRRSGIGASEMGIVMGVSPYKTPYQLWEEKTGRFVDTPDGIHWGMKRGLDLEPKARALFELEHGLDMIPVCRESESLPWLRASLDGWCEEERAILEIKCLGRSGLQEASLGEIPEHYMYQMAHQIAVMDARRVYYYVFDGEKGLCIEKDASDFKEHIVRLMKEGAKFWDHVKRDVPPPLDKKDFKGITIKGKKKDFENLKICKANLINAVRDLSKAEGKALEGLPLDDRMRCADVGVLRRKDHYEFIYPTSLGKKNLQPCPLVQVWNENCGQLSKIKGLAGTRESMARARWKELPDLDYWISATKRVRNSKFCNGDNNFGSWRATFDWLIKPATHLKVAEGKYDDNKVDKKSPFDFNKIFS